MKHLENLTANSITQLLKECRETGNKYLPILTSYVNKLYISEGQMSQKNLYQKFTTNYQYAAIFYRFLRMAMNFQNVTHYFDMIEEYLIDEPKNNRPYYTFSNGYLYDKIINFSEISYEFIDFSLYFLKYSKKMIKCLNNYDWLQFLDKASTTIYAILEQSKDLNDQLTTSMYLECMLLSKIYDCIQLIFSDNLLI